MKWEFSGPGEWYARWPHFRPEEFACRHCGELPQELDTELLDRLEALRKKIGTPLRVNSGYRCAAHNAIVGGAVYSQHKKLAVDLSLSGHAAPSLYRAALESGFLGIGIAETFIHLDMRREIDGYQPPRRLTIWKYQKKWPKWFQDIHKKKDLIT